MKLSIRDIEYIRLSLKKDETLNSRNERSIPLYKLRKYLIENNVLEDDFKSYLYRYAPQNMRDYIEEVSKQLYHTPEEEIDPEAKFLITSGLC
jgi:hypothetical protein